MGRPSFRSSPPPTENGFTLVEILVATTVLILLVLLVTRLTDSTSKVTIGSRKHMDADGQARVVFDRMGYDFAKMPRRADLDCIFSNQIASNPPNAPNDAMYFYSEAPAYYDGGSSDFTPRSTTALIGYRINAAWQLERLGKLLTWDGSAAAATPGAVVCLSYPAATVSPSPTATPTPFPASTLLGSWPSAVGKASDIPPYSAGTDTDFHVLGEQVFRLAFCFLLRPYTIPAVPAGSGTPTAYPGFYSVNPYNALLPGNSRVTGAQGTGLQDVEAIVVAIAILDPTSRKVVPTSSVTVGGSTVQAPTLGNLASAFPDPTAADLQTPTAPTTAPPVPTLMAQKWLAAMNSSAFAPSDIPRNAASQVRIYQRTFYLK